MTTLIAGGGLAGAAAACILGRDATLIEREAAPHDKICGEFISWDAQSYLARLGIDALALGASPITAVRLIHKRTTVRTRLPGMGLGLSRRLLDEAVLAQAAQNGAAIIRGHNIRRLIRNGLDVDGLGPLKADRILLATGKHDLRNAKRRSRASRLVGFKIFYRLNTLQADALAGHVEIILFPGGYAGLQPVEAGLVNLCLLIDQSVFRNVGATWPGVVTHLVCHAPHLADRLREALPALERPLTIFGVPYGFVHRPSPVDPPELFRLGDQMGVIPSFSGDGMAIALHTASAAARADGSRAYHLQMRGDLRNQIGRAMVLHRFGQSQPRLLTDASRIWPGALGWVARLTRVTSAPEPQAA